MNAFVQRLALAVHARNSPWLRDVVPALGGLALHFDPAFEGSVLQAAGELVEQAIRDGLPKSSLIGREVELPVCYDPEFALDTDEVARAARISVEEVARRHAAGEYRVLMIGFSPGHGYLAGLDPKLAVPRRATPRPLVAAGSVAIANLQSVVYPYAISGGWNVIGRTPAVMFDARREPPSLLGAGDRVRFRAIGRDEFDRASQA